MAIALRAQAVNASPGVSQGTHTATLTLEAGDLVIVVVGGRDTATIDSCVGSLNGTYTLVGSVVTNSNNNNKSAIYYFENSAAGSETVTVTFSANARAGVNISAWTGAKTSGALDQNDGAFITAGATSHNSGSINATAAGLIIVEATISGASGGFTFTDFTAMTSPESIRYNPFYRVITGALTETGDYSTVNSVLSTNKMASFLESTGGNVTRTLSDAVVLGDETIRTRQRGRYFSEIVVITDAGVEKTYAITTDDAVEMADELYQTRVRGRVLGDAIALIDEFIKAVSQGAVINERLLTDVLALTDGFMSSRLRGRLSEEALAMIDGFMSSRLRDRAMDDTTVLTDQGIASRSYYRDLVDALSTTDFITVSLTLPTMPPTVEVRVRLGIDDRTELGGYN